MTRRHIKEYRPDEALHLISADRTARPLQCPSCGSDAVQRDPARVPGDTSPAGRVVISCDSCGRAASYIDRGEGRGSHA